MDAVCRVSFSVACSAWISGRGVVIASIAFQIDGGIRLKGFKVAVVSRVGVGVAGAAVEIVEQRSSCCVWEVSFEEGIPLAACLGEWRVGVSSRRFLDDVLDGVAGLGGNLKSCCLSSVGVAERARWLGNVDVELLLVFLLAFFAGMAVGGLNVLTGISCLAVPVRELILISLEISLEMSLKSFFTKVSTIFIFSLIFSVVSFPGLLLGIVSSDGRKVMIQASGVEVSVIPRD